MQQFEQKLRTGIVRAFGECFGSAVEEAQITFQPTRKEFQGTHTFVTFPFLKITKESPEETGQKIGEYLLKQGNLIEGYNVVKGFLNLVLGERTWLGVLSDMLDDDEYGKGATNNRKVMVEFSSPNTNKPLHLGHLRNIFLGDSVSRILVMAGYDVMKTNLVNDRGIHICKSMLAYQKFGKGETPEEVGLKGDHLVGKYYVVFDQHYKAEIDQLTRKGMDAEEAARKAPMITEAQELLKKWEKKDPETVGLWEKLNGWVYDGFDKTYSTMGISFDKIYHESETYLLGKDIVEEGLQKKVFFEESDGSVWADLSNEGLDRKLVRRADGTSVYMTQDMGTCDFKYNDFPMEKSVYVVGNEQDYHFKVLFKIMKKLGRSYGDGLYHLSYGMVDLPGGKMKSREGTVVDADELMEEMFGIAERHTKELGKIESLSDSEASSLFKTLGLGALKYFLLKVDPKKRMLFDPEESIEFHGHTGPFVQYTFARISAILRRADQLNKEPTVDVSIESLNAVELDIISHLSKYPEAIQLAAEQYSPAVIAQYIYDLAKNYNSFYQEIPIFNEEDDSALRFRLALSQCTSRVIKSGMGLLGIDVPDRM